MRYESALICVASRVINREVGKSGNFSEKLGFISRLPKKSGPFFHLLYKDWPGVVILKVRHFLKRF